MWEATLRVAVENVATPEALRLVVPRAVVPSLNATEPVAMPETDAVTVAVNVTELPENDGLELETSAVEVFCCTVWVRTVEVAERLTLSPP